MRLYSKYIIQSSVDLRKWMLIACWFNLTYLYNLKFNDFPFPNISILDIYRLEFVKNTYFKLWKCNNLRRGIVILKYLIYLSLKFLLRFILKKEGYIHFKMK